MAVIIDKRIDPHELPEDDLLDSFQEFSYRGDFPTVNRYKDEVKRRFAALKNRLAENDLREEIPSPFMGQDLYSPVVYPACAGDSS